MARGQHFQDLCQRWTQRECRQVPDACGSAVTSISALRQPQAHSALPPSMSKTPTAHRALIAEGLNKHVRNEHFSTVLWAKSGLLALMATAVEPSETPVSGAKE